MKSAHPGRDFERLFREYFRPLTVFAMQYVKVMEVAEDIVQDMFLYLHEKGDLSGEEPFPTPFLYRMVRNRCLNHLDYQNIRKRKNPEIETAAGFSSNPHDPLEYVKRIELEHRYLQAVEGLAPKCREVFEMSRIGGSTNQEIAELLSLSKRTVETHISQALKILRKKLVEYIRVILF